MKLSIVQRTIMGFTLMFVLMAILAGISLFNAKNLQGKVERITLQSTPMVVSSSELMTQLMQTNLLTYTFQHSTNAGSLDIDKQFAQQRTDFFNTLAQNQQYSTSEQDDANATPLRDASTAYFQTAEQLIALQKEAGRLALQRQQLDLKLLRLEDTYQWAANLLLVKASVQRSLQNRAELITSGIARDMKMLRRANQKTNLNELRTLLTKDIEMAVQRLEHVSVAEDVKARYVRNLKQVEQLILGKNGMIDVMLRQQSLQEQVQQARAQTEKRRLDVHSKLESYAQYAQSMAKTAHEETQNAEAQAITYIVSTALIAAVLSIWIALSTTRRIQKPLAIINTVLNKMTDGDMRTRTHYQYRDEFGHLSRSIDTLADTMSRTLTQFNDGAKHLLQEADKAAQASENAIHRIEDQKLRTDQVAAAISQMEVSAQEIANSTEVTVTEVENTSLAANTGRNQVSRSRELTEQLSSNIEEAVSNTQQLNQYSKNIGSILHVIQDIAEQTNLLALNAAIEAARAGPQGRGFAVVADEVRALANRTQQSTEEIQLMITNLQGNASKMASTMGMSQKQMEDCLTQTRLTDQTLQDIVSRMQSIEKMTSHIAQATEEQIKVSNDVAEHIHGIANVAYAAEKDARDSALRSETLAHLAQAQEKLISNFRV